jgi:2-dehydropantoate 2-reductase
MREVVAVARAQGIGLEDRDVDDQVMWTERAGAIRTSTTVDRERGREMEIDALIGVVVRRGKQFGVPTPCSDVMLALLRGIE